MEVPVAQKNRRKSAINKKISKLRHEGEPEKKSVAIALNMAREHRLTPSGGYIRGKKKSRRKGVKQ
jgi:hypothetical protein